MPKSSTFWAGWTNVTETTDDRQRDKWQTDLRRLRDTVVEYNGLWPANFPNLALDLQLMDEHL